MTHRTPHDEPERKGVATRECKEPESGSVGCPLIVGLPAVHQPSPEVSFSISRGSHSATTQTFSCSVADPVEQLVYVLAPQIQEPILELSRKVITQESISEQLVKQITDVPLPQTVEHIMQCGFSGKTFAFSKKKAFRADRLAEACTSNERASQT